MVSSATALELLNNNLLAPARRAGYHKADFGGKGQAIATGYVTSATSGAVLAFTAVAGLDAFISLALTGVLSAGCETRNVA